MRNALCKRPGPEFCISGSCRSCPPELPRATGNIDLNTKRKQQLIFKVFIAEFANIAFLTQSPQQVQSFAFGLNSIEYCT